MTPEYPKEASGMSKWTVDSDGGMTRELDAFLVGFWVGALVMAAGIFIGWYWL